jgi:hypothetical protein
MMSMPPPSVFTASQSGHQEAWIPDTLRLVRHGRGLCCTFPFTLLHCSRSRASWRTRAHSEDILAGGVFFCPLPEPLVGMCQWMGRNRWIEQRFHAFCPNRKSRTLNSPTSTVPEVTRCRLSRSWRWNEKWKTF